MTNVSRITGLLDFSTTYRVGELEDLINDTGVSSIAQDLCQILVVIKANVTPYVWGHIRSTLVNNAIDGQFHLMTEQEDDENS